MIERIDPLNIDQKHYTNFVSLLNNNPSRKIWRSHKCYELGNKTYSFTHDIYAYPSVYGPIVYNVLAKGPLGTGVSGGVYSVLGSFGVNKHGIDYHKQPDPLVAKVQKMEGITKNMALEQRRVLIHEVDYTPVHLGIKGYNIDVRSMKNDPEKFEFTSIIIMLKLPGIELFALFAQIFNENKYLLPSSMRIMIMLETLKAIKTQVADLQMVHGDIKSENIIIDLGTEDFRIKDGCVNLPNTFEARDHKNIKVGIIDYASSYYYGEPINHFMYTSLFACPQFMQKRKQAKKDEQWIAFKADDKFDSFSTGKMLMYLWSWDLNQKFVNNVIFDYQTMDIHKKYFSAQEPAWFSKECLGKIIKITLSLTDENLETRYTIEQAIDQTTAVIDEYFLPNAPEFFDTVHHATPEPDDLEVEWSDSEDDLENADTFCLQKIQSDIEKLNITPQGVADRSPWREANATMTPISQSMYRGGLFSPVSVDKLNDVNPANLAANSPNPG